MLILNLLIPIMMGAVAGWLTKGSVVQYDALVLPPYAPPSWVFPLAWLILYLMMGAANWLIMKSDTPQEQKKHTQILYAVQLAVNFVWPLIFFNTDQYGTAFVWLLLLLALVLAMTVAAAKVNKLAAWLLVPYILWLLYAAYLNYFVWQLNG